MTNGFHNPPIAGISSSNHSTEETINTWAYAVFYNFLYIILLKRVLRSFSIVRIFHINRYCVYISYKQCIFSFFFNFYVFSLINPKGLKLSKLNFSLPSWFAAPCRDFYILMLAGHAMESILKEFRNDRIRAKPTYLSSVHIQFLFFFLGFWKH